MDPRMLLEVIRLTNPAMYQTIFDLWVEQGLIVLSQKERWEACLKKTREQAEAMAS